MPVPPMVIAELTLPHERESTAWPLERIAEHFALCPGLMGVDRRGVDGSDVRD